ncbi:MAG: hypothetical protein ACPG4T_14525 [Nannocystaceae bacterium]
MRDPDASNPGEQLRVARLNRPESPQTSSNIVESNDVGVSQTAGVGQLKATQAAQASEQTVGASEVRHTDPLAPLSHALAAGEVRPSDARERLIDQIVRSQMPANTPPTTLERIRSEVAEMLRLDPTLQELLTP